MFDLKRERIYKHSHLNQADADRLRPLMENAFRDELARYNDRPALREEKLRFITEQYANRCRVSQALGQHPLHEDANIFAGLGDGNLKNLFESVSAPNNIINMGNVRNPMNGTDVDGGIWNPGYKRGTGDIPSYVFGLQSHIALHCIGFDLIPMISVDTPKPMVSYVDIVYGGGELANTGTLPSYLEFASSIFTKTWITTHNLKRAKSEVIIIADTDGEKYAVKVRFMSGSTVHAAMNIQVLNTGKATTLPVNGTSVGAYTWDNSVSVKDIIDTVGDSNKKHVVVIEDTATPANTYVSADGDFTELYASYLSATRTNIAEAVSNNNSFGGMNREQMEKGPVHKLNVVTMDEQLDIVGIEIEADTTNIQIKDMAAMGIQVISLLYSGVQNSLVQSLDEFILDHLYKMGTTAAVNAYQSQGINHSLYIDNPANTQYNMANYPFPFDDILGVDRRADMGTITNTLVTTGYENQLTHNERLYRRILLIAEYIEQQTRIAPADTLVAGGELCAAIKAHSQFVVSPTPTSITKAPGVQYYGTLYQTINVYKNPKCDFNDSRILIFRRGDDKDTGSKLLAYDLAASRQIVAEQTMAEKIRVWSRFKIADIGFYPELNYYTMVAINNYKFI